MNQAAPHTYQFPVYSQKRLKWSPFPASLPLSLVLPECSPYQLVLALQQAVLTSQSVAFKTLFLGFIMTSVVALASITTKIIKPAELSTTLHLVLGFLLTGTPKMTSLLVLAGRLDLLRKFSFLLCSSCSLLTK